MADMQHTSRRATDDLASLRAQNANKTAPGKTQATDKLAPRTVQTDSNAAAQDQKPGKDAAAQISPQDIQYELIAHKMGYQDTIGAVEGELLAKWGYRSSWTSKINDAATGFFVGLIMPGDEHPELKPILVFRGTGGMRDIISDIHPVAVGYDQFSQNQRFVEQLISEAGGEVDVTGHSLGGALAQHATAAFASSVNRCVTFQAPGINFSQANSFANEEDKPEVTHHIAGGDLVDTAGDAHLDGDTFRHTPGGGPTSHTKFLLTTPEFKEEREKLGITDEVLGKLDIDKQNNHKPIEHHNKYPHPIKNAVDETVRKGVGVGLYPVLSGLSALTRNDDAALREQITNAQESQLAGLPISERSYMVDRLCRGATGNGDENAILKVLRASAAAGDAVKVVDLTGAYLIATNVHGSQYRELRSFYRRHYYAQTSQSQAIKILRSCIDGVTSEWEEEMIADILVDRSDGRAIITRIGAIYDRGGFSEGLSEIQWQLDGSDQDRVDAIYDR